MLATLASALQSNVIAPIATEPSRPATPHPLRSRRSLAILRGNDRHRAFTDAGADSVAFENDKLVRE